jgi:hypothetical protein
MKKVILILCIVVLLSCENKTNENGQDVNNVLEIGSVSVDKVSENNLYLGPTNYMKVLQNNPVIGYSSSTSDPLSESKFVTFDGSIQTPLTKSSRNNVDVLINGKNISDLKLTTKGQSQNFISSDLYGKDVLFTLSPATKSQNSSEKSISLYIPYTVEIISPQVDETNLYPCCYYKDFVLRWNPDLKNENGLVIVVEWYGFYFNGENENLYVRNSDLLQIDDGEEILNYKLFDDIPDNAICYITLVRGNLENIELEEDMAYLVAGESHAVLPLVLVRNL